MICYQHIFNCLLLSATQDVISSKQVAQMAESTWGGGSHSIIDLIIHLVSNQCNNYN